MMQQSTLGLSLVNKLVDTMAQFLHHKLEHPLLAVSVNGSAAELWQGLHHAVPKHNLRHDGVMIMINEIPQTCLQNLERNDKDFANHPLNLHVMVVHNFYLSENIDFTQVILLPVLGLLLAVVDVEDPGPCRTRTSSWTR